MENEPKVMWIVGFQYRAWTSDANIGKGYVARINTAQLNIKRKRLSKNVRRWQRTALRNARGAAIRVTKDIVKFDLDKHVIINIEDSDNEQQM